MSKHNWILTDPSCSQFRLDISNSKYIFQEFRITNPETKEGKIFKAEIDLDDYSWTEIIEACDTFGYDKETVAKWLTERKELDLIAECLFELEN